MKNATKIKKEENKTKVEVVTLTRIQRTILNAIRQGIKDIDEKKPDGLTIYVALDYDKEEIKVHVDYNTRDKLQKALEKTGLIVLK